MATSGTFYTNVGSGWRLQMEWTLNSQSVSSNTSSITARLYWMSLGSSYTVNSTATKTAGIQYNDGSWNRKSASGLAALSGNQKKLIHSRTFTIYHSSDGSGSFNLDGYFSAQVTLSGVYYGTIDLAQKSYTLPTIPRMSNPTLNDSTVYMRDQTVTIYTNRASSSFTHTITYKFGSKTGTIATGVGTSTTWTPSISLANQLPRDTNGLGTIYCKTYSGSTYIGQESISIRLYIPSNVLPSVSINKTGVDLKSSYYVQNKSKVSVSLSESGIYGSTISSRKTTINGASYTTTSFTTGILKTAGTNTITTTVTDSRGRSKTVTSNISVVAYSNPIASNFVSYRCNSSGTQDQKGEYIFLSGTSSISPINNANGKSTYLRYRETGASTWLTANSDVDNYNLTLEAIVPADENKSFETELLVSDDYSTTIVRENVGTAFVLMDYHASGQSIGIGKVSEGINVLEIGGDVDVDGVISARFSSQRVASGEDLNNLMTPGMYYSPYNADAENILNAPTNSAFSLLVEKHAGYKQTFTVYNSPPRTFIRNYYTSWGSWYELTMSAL